MTVRYPCKSVPVRHGGMLRCYLRSITALLRHESGVAAVEFALVLPIMVVLWIGGVEVTSALSVDRRLNNLNSSIGDLVAREKRLTFDQLNGIFAIAPAAMFPHAASGITLRVSGVIIDDDQNAKVAWSRDCKVVASGDSATCTTAGAGHAAFAEGFDVSGMIEPSLRVPGSQIIMSESFYVHRPAVGYVISGDMSLEDRMFFVPRLVTAVQLCDNAGANCKPLP